MHYMYTMDYLKPPNDILDSTDWYEVNTFVVKVVKVDWLDNIWKTLNKVDRLSLSDTDERAKVMPK